jgi:hypothetical protein
MPGALETWPIVQGDLSIGGKRVPREMLLDVGRIEQFLGRYER